MNMQSLSPPFIPEYITAVDNNDEDILRFSIYFIIDLTVMILQFSDPINLLIRYFSR